MGAIEMTSDTAAECIAIYATNEQNEWVMSGASFLSIK